MRTFLKSQRNLSEIAEQEFLLVYHGHYSFEAVQIMAIREREWHLERLSKEKKEEQEAMDRASRKK